MREGRRPQRRRGRAPLLLLLGHRHELLRGGREAARREAAVGEARAGAVRAGGPQVPPAADALPDLGVFPHGAGALQQHHPHHGGGDGGRPGRDAVPPHKLLRRGDRPADGFQRQARAQHAAHPPGGDRDRRRRRPLGRVLLHGVAHPGDGEGGGGDHQGGRRSRRHDQGHRRRGPEAADRGMRREAAGRHRQRQADHRRRQQVPLRRLRQRGARRALDRQRPGARAADTAARGGPAAARRSPRVGGARAA
mmetsp:Transcript_40382/g.95955  ORF Transcript_40382/g.95955 Transcript_40382/m.95955 type:complete len:251 (+) Transcript_40382:1281-2033(+)